MFGFNQKHSKTLKTRVEIRPNRGFVSQEDAKAFVWHWSFGTLKIKTFYQQTIEAS